MSQNNNHAATLVRASRQAPGYLKTLLAFLNGQSRNPKPLLTMQEPHQPGRMPVIFIHGTTANALAWADMTSALLTVPAIREHYAFWFFTYASGNPIPHSAYHLRQAIAAAVAGLGGVEGDPALGQMTLIGHSQGGLLAKMLTIDPGDQLWNGMGVPPLSSLKISPQNRALAQAMFFPTPMPEVRRVIFLSTPQHGSFIAGFSLARMIARLVRLPREFTQAAAEAFGGNGRYVSVDGRRVILGSISGMSPVSPFNRALASIPLAAGVHAHSIISVSSAGPFAPASFAPASFTQGDDGVVSYVSAHIPGVDSELVIHSSHSSRNNPAAIAEVQRLLELQLAAFPA